MNKKMLLFVLLVVALAAGFIVVAMRRTDPPNHTSVVSPVNDEPVRAPAARVGAAAPGFKLETAQGSSCQLETLSGSVVLLSFLYVPRDLDLRECQQSRSQVNFLKSMDKQYGPKGVKTVLIDATELVPGKKADNDTLVNFPYDWGLEDVPLLKDDNLETAGRYSVRSLPTTFLISRDGTISQRWEGIALTSQMALAIEGLAGRPDYATAGPTATPTHAEARFPGLIPARPLSDRIWLVDGGKPWQRQGPYPTRWLVLHAGKLTLKVTAKNIRTGRSVDIIESDMEPVPEAEARILLSNMPDAEPALSLLDVSVQIQEAGHYEVKARLVRHGTGDILCEGTAIVPVD